jgi:hypothetical protein
MFDSWLQLFIFGIASFRLTRLVVYDNVTEFIRKPFHKEINEIEADGTTSTYIEIKGTGLQRWIGELLSCYWCSGVWCASILYFYWIIWPSGSEPLIIILAIAGVAGIIETIVSKLLD